MCNDTFECRTATNLKENEARQLERIEEEFLRKVLKTTRGCPIVQLYFELGQIPARFEVQKMRCLYLKKILDQNEDSQLLKFFKLQMDHRAKGDWASTCLTDLKELEIEESFEEIKTMSKYKFSNILKDRIQKNAFKYLKGKQRSKGSEILYTDIQMAEYLLPCNSKLTISQKQHMFAIRNRMLEISENFPGKDISEICCCGKLESMLHIYSCEKLNNGSEQHLEYNGIFGGKKSDHKKLLRPLKTIGS